MKIRYSKRRRFLNVVLGLVFALTGSLKVFEDPTSYFYYFQLVLGMFMIGLFFFERQDQYLKIENGQLTKNSLLKKTVRLDKIEKIESLPGKIKLFTSEESLSINTGLIEEDSLKDLYRVLGSLELEFQENPFTGWSRTKTSEE